MVIFIIFCIFAEIYVKMKYTTLFAASFLAFCLTSCNESSTSENKEVKEAVLEYAQRNFKDDVLEIESVVLKDTTSNIRVATLAQREVEELDQLSILLQDSLSSAYVNALEQIQHLTSSHKELLQLELDKVTEKIHNESSNPQHILDVQDFAVDYGNLFDAIEAILDKYEGESTQYKYQIKAKKNGQDIKLSAFQDAQTKKIMVNQDDLSVGDLSKEARMIAVSLPKVKAYYMTKNTNNQQTLEMVNHILNELKSISK